MGFNISDNKPYNKPYDTWKIGPTFTHVKYLGPLREFGEAAKVARFGHTKNLVPDETEKVKNRIMGFEMMHHTLVVLSHDIRFAMGPYSRIKLAGQMRRLEIVKPYMKKVLVKEVNHLTHNTKEKINEELFDKIFMTLLDVCSIILMLMNENGMIFFLSKDVDLDSLMADVVHSG